MSLQDKFTVDSVATTKYLLTAAALYFLQQLGLTCFILAVTVCVHLLGCYISSDFCLVVFCYFLTFAALRNYYKLYSRYVQDKKHDIEIKSKNK